MAQKDLKIETTDKKDFKRNDMSKHTSVPKEEFVGKGPKKIKHDSSKLPRLR